MTLFQDYATYYNLFYQDKDYAAEAEYLQALIGTHHAGAATLLDLGCGTGGHAFPLARLGYQVTGVDLSAVSIAQAQARLQTDKPPKAFLRFQQADIRTLQLHQRFDVVTALFHVLSYQTTHADITATLTTVRKHLAPGGIFICDFWYGPGVLSDPPRVAVKRLENATLRVTRLAEPQMHPNRNVVDVHYTIFALHKPTGQWSETRETHPMRYFFKPELEQFLMEAGLEMRCFYTWMTREAPGVGDWLGAGVFKSYERHPDIL